MYSLAHSPAQCTMYIYYFIDFPSRSNSDAHALKEVRDLLKNDLNKENMEKAVCFLINIKNIWDQRPNLKNLNRGLKFELVALKIVFNVSRFKPGAQLKPVLADMRRGSISLNSDTVCIA